MIPKVMGALGTIPLRLEENLRTIGVDTSIELIQVSGVSKNPKESVEDVGQGGKVK